MSRRVFLSYSRGSRQADRLKKLLEKSGLETWLDEEQLHAGDPVGQRIQEGIAECDCCVFLLDRSSAISTWCIAEVSAFWASGKPVIIYRTDPDVSLPPHLADRKFTSELQDVVKACSEAISKRPATSPSAKLLSHLSALAMGGAHSAFRIPAQNAFRDQRTKELLGSDKELRLRLCALSGRSYLNSHGAAWKAGVGAKVIAGSALDVVLCSPFSSFANARAHANRTTLDHWKHSVSLPRLRDLEKNHNVTIKVTEHPINCSLFFVGESVFYDPYLWSSPSAESATENNFWVIEFARTSTEDPADSYNLLEGHFNFLWKESIPLETFVSEHGGQFLQ